ncbi:MAG: flagellar basal body P-ring formation protein FlgA, partial [Nitrospinaceae bacterium]|nr:flagellar basal body P-ring formation protein FlgA [Nitrospinaceae bacterium]
MIRFYKYSFLTISLLILVLAWTGVNRSWAITYQVIDKMEIREQAEAYLVGKLDWAKDRLNVRVEVPGKDIVVPHGEVNLQYRLPGGTRRVGRIPFILMVKVDGAIRKKVRLFANISIAYNIYRARHSLPRGHIVKSGDVEMAQIQSDRILRNVVSDRKNIMGYQLMRNVGEGEKLLTHMVKKVPVVKRGDRILLVAQKGNIK